MADIPGYITQPDGTYKSNYSGTVYSAAELQAQGGGSGGSTGYQGPGGGPGATGVSILTGRNMQWFRDAQGNYYLAYGLPNSTRYAFFEATPQQMDARFGVGSRPSTTTIGSLSDLTKRTGYTFSGNIGEVAGTGSFESAVERSIAVALGGDTPEWMANAPEIWDVLYLAEAENKSDDWVLNQIKATKPFQDRFPGISTFEKMGLTLGESVTAFMEFEQGLKRISQRYPTGQLAVTPQVVGDLAARGQSIEDVQFVFDVFDRMEQNQASFENFNEVLSSKGLDPLGQADQFAFLAGTAPPELYNIWEQASVLTAAEAAGIKSFGVNEALAVARNTPGMTSEAQAFQGMTQAAKYILQYRREVDLGRLDQDDLIDLSLGAAPRSGRSQAELAQEMSRIVREAEAFIGNKIRPYMSFSKTGKPVASSLGELKRSSSYD